MFNFKNDFLKMLIIMAIVALSGCATAPVSVVTKTDTVVVSIPETLLTQCLIDSPPNRESYIASTWPNKEKLLSTYSVSLLKNLSDCNLQLKNALLFQNKQKLLYSTTSNK